VTALACGATDIPDAVNLGSPCRALYGNTFTDEVTAAGVHLVPTYDQFVGHGSWASGSNQWSNATVSTPGGIPVHPDATDEQQMADILESALAANGIS
jgi:hypothetical protein